MGWMRVRTADGSWTLLEPETGRALHDLAGARSEARGRFAAAAGLDRVSATGRVRLLDVGCGIALNLAAATEQATARGFALQVCALEARAELLEQAHALPPDPDPAFETARRQVLAELGRGDSPLLLGDAAEIVGGLSEAAFDLVFLDGFAPSAGGSLWSLDLQRELAARLAPGGVLVSFTASARLRAAWMALGLEVGPGPRLGRKQGGTCARRPPSKGQVVPLEPRLGPPLTAAAAAKLGRRAARLAPTLRGTPSPPG